MTKHTTPTPERRKDAYLERDLKSIAARWDARAAIWDQELKDPDCHLNEDAAYDRFLRAAREEIRRQAEFCRATGVIDAGCGTGLVLADVIRAFAWGIGVDISAEMIRVASAKQIPSARFILGDCFELSLLCPKAGVILSRGVLLSHYGRAQGQAFLHAVLPALIPGGFFIFDFLNINARSASLHVPENKTYFSAGEVRSMLQLAGFGPVAIGAEQERRALIAVARREQ